MSDHLEKIKNDFCKLYPLFNIKLILDLMTWLGIILWIFFVCYTFLKLYPFSWGKIFVFLLLLVSTAIYCAYFEIKVRPKYAIAKPKISDFLEVLSKYNIKNERQVDLLIDEIDHNIKITKEKQNDFVKILMFVLKLIGGIVSVIGVGSFTALLSSKQIILSFDDIKNFALSLMQSIAVVFGFLGFCIMTWEPVAVNRYAGGLRLAKTREILLDVKLYLNKY
ncbi:hypothetical protein [Lactobacillus sp. ESL0681]|uniref:hypothetical protein n=1 Tax=Lactobacillus sp. ESL0681 TaxID=2983211 RepID=UPI0023FA2227|nr:hypothetical protein [Lactobacillus sp. ESL0681]WEV40293.1 hypothetical protein OZX59_09000 [Lactobacillus sp. ESL0681]